MKWKKSKSTQIFSLKAFCFGGLSEEVRSSWRSSGHKTAAINWLSELGQTIHWSVWKQERFGLVVLLPFLPAPSGLSEAEEMLVLWDKKQLTSRRLEAWIFPDHSAEQKKKSKYLLLICSYQHQSCCNNAAVQWPCIQSGVSSGGFLSDCRFSTTVAE